MSQLKFIFRADRTNVGDWACPPFKYFPFKPFQIGDILDEKFSIRQDDIVIIGGGGIGTNFFKQYLERIKRFNNQNLILWGAGVDVVSDKKSLLLKNEKYEFYGSYFDFIKEIGIRVFTEPQRYNYVPCASCMSNLFFKYRDVKPNNLIGCYSHKRVPLNISFNEKIIPSLTNENDNLEEKLIFLSNFEYIVTNTYHGLYWGTLLNRKVIVLPFKSGLLSFKYKPVYCYDLNDLNEETLHSAKRYEIALAESRKFNFNFYSYLTNKYDIA